MTQKNNKIIKQPLPPEIIDRFLDVQQQEIEIRAKELSLHEQQENNNKSLSEQSIQANLQNRDSERGHIE